MEYPIEYLFEMAYKSVFQPTVYVSGNKSGDFIDLQNIIADILEYEGFISRRNQCFSIFQLETLMESTLQTDEFKIWVDQKIEKGHPESKLLVFLIEKPRLWDRSPFVHFVNLKGLGGSESFILSEDFKILLDESFEKGHVESEFLLNYKTYLQKRDVLRYRGSDKYALKLLSGIYEPDIYKWMLRIQASIDQRRKSDKKRLEDLFEFNSTVFNNFQR
jgi:hypothetical protein